MTVACDICGQEVKNMFYLGQHLKKKEDLAHNSGEGKPKTDTSGTTENLVDEWKEDVQEEAQEDSDTVEWETESSSESKEYRALNPDHPIEEQMLMDGYDEIEDNPEKDFEKLEVR